MPETQKVWTDKQARFWIAFSKIFAVTWLLMVIAGIYVMTDENFVRNPYRDPDSIFVSIPTIAGLFGFILFGLMYRFFWPDTLPLTAEQISDLYDKVSVCPHQMDIIKDAVRHNFILRKRDLEFANRIYQIHQERISQQVEDEKKQKVLQAIKDDS